MAWLFLVECGILVPMQISELMAELLEARAERVAAGTLARDRWLVGLINSGIGDVDIESITARDLHRWAVELREVVAPSSAEAAVGLVRRAFRWGHAAGMVSWNPARQLSGRPWLDERPGVEVVK